MFFKFTTFTDYIDWGIFNAGEFTPNDKIDAYLNAYYQSFLLMVGNVQPSYNNLERCFMIVVLIMGACFYSAMVGQMAVLVANVNAVAQRHRTKQDTTMDVLRCARTRGTPERLAGRKGGLPAGSNGQARLCHTSKLTISAVPRNC